MNKKLLLQLAAVAFIGMVAGVAYGNKVPGVDSVASNLPGSRTKQ